MDVQTPLQTVWRCLVSTDHLFLLNEQLYVCSPFSLHKEKLPRASFCLLMEMFTFPREKHYSLGVMSAGAQEWIGGGGHWSMHDCPRGSHLPVLQLAACLRAGPWEGVSVLQGLHALCTAHSLNELPKCV